MEWLKYNTSGQVLFTVLIEAGGRNARINPTLASGDVKISKDGGAFTNIATLPDVMPSSDVQVRIQLSASELQAKIITIRFRDQTSPAEWEEQYVQICTYGNASAFIPFDFSQTTPNVNVSSISDGAITANAIASNAITSAKIATDAIGSAQFSQAAADKVWNSTTRTLTSFGTLVSDIWSHSTRTLTSGSGITVDANLVSIDGQATNGNNATLNLKQLNIQNSSGTAVVMKSTAANGWGLYVESMQYGGAAILSHGSNVACLINNVECQESALAMFGSNGIMASGTGCGINIQGVNTSAIRAYSPANPAVLAEGGGAEVVKISGTGSTIGVNVISSNGYGIKVSGSTALHLNGTSSCGMLADGVICGIRASSLYSNGHGILAEGGVSGMRCAGTMQDGHGLSLCRGGSNGHDLNFETPDCTVPTVTNLTNKTGFSLTSAYDPAKTAAQENTLSNGLTTVNGKLDAIYVLDGAIHSVAAGTATNVSTIVNALPATGKISNLAMTDVVDGGVTLKEVLTGTLAMACGRFRKDYPVSGQVTFYKRNDSDVAFVVNVTESERTRV